MIQAQDFIQPAFEKAYRFWAGVPCSFLTPLINGVIQSPQLTYVGAASEGEAVAIAFGAHLAGKKTVVICQNSGLGNTINPLASLNQPFRVPTLLIVTHRGAPGLKDEPQHALMGTITTQLLDTLGIRWKSFPDQSDEIPALLEEAESYMSSQNRPFALIMKKGTVAPCALVASSPQVPVRKKVKGEFSSPKENWMKRREAIALIRGALQGDELVVATTGKIGRELFALGHRPNQIYIVGGMGCASGIGLGLSLSQPQRKVVVLDGDGAALMKMGTLGTIGFYRPRNLIHIILDNEAHESTGGQATVSRTVDFAEVASACSYSIAYRSDTEQGLKGALQAALKADEGPALIHVKAGIESAFSLGRPTLTPVQVKKQFMEFISKGAAVRHG